MIHGQLCHLCDDKPFFFLLCRNHICEDVSLLHGAAGDGEHNYPGHKKGTWTFFLRYTGGGLNQRIIILSPGKQLRVKSLVNIGRNVLYF